MPVHDRKKADWGFHLFQDADLEPCLEAYKSHLIEINKIVLESKEKLEGNLFYFHESTPVLDAPEPGRKHKRFNYGFFVLGGNKLLEIGFNAGHSALLALTSNPDLVYVGVDLANHRYTIPCFKYLESVFGNRINLIVGDSRDERRLCRCVRRPQHLAHWVRLLRRGINLEITWFRQSFS
jgi:hypothetical protein